MEDKERDAKNQRGVYKYEGEERTEHNDSPICQREHSRQIPNKSRPIQRNLRKLSSFSSISGELVKSLNVNPDLRSTLDNHLRRKTVNRSHCFSPILRSVRFATGDGILYEKRVSYSGLSKCLMAGSNCLNCINFPAPWYPRGVENTLYSMTKSCSRH